MVAINIGMFMADAFAMTGLREPLAVPLALGAVRLFLFTIALAVVSRAASERTVAGTLAVVLVANTLFAEILGTLRGQPETVSVAAVATAIGSAVLVPWGPRWQAAVVACLVVILAGGTWLAPAPTVPLILAVVSMGTVLTTIYLAHELVSTRARLMERARLERESRGRSLSLHADLESKIRARTATLDRMRVELEHLCHEASHDLRPPLRTMAGFGEILHESAVDRGRPEDAARLQRIVEIARTMGARIDTLLQSARSVHRRIAGQAVDLSAVARAVQYEVDADGRARRWIVQDGVVVDPAPDSVVRLLRALLEYAASDAYKTPVSCIEFARRPSDAAAFAVRIIPAPVDADERRRIARSLSGELAFAELPAGFTDVVAAARALTASHAGRVRVDEDEDAALTFVVEVARHSTRESVS